MTCLNPITAWKKRYSSLTQRPEDYYRDKKLKFKKPGQEIIKDYEEIKIACGHCIGCKLDHANTWATRIMLESKRHKKNCFITLTYNPEHLPINEKGKMTLRKKDVQDFIKRLRWHLQEKILYFGCGEYGTTTFRPHYHLIIFGYEPDDLKSIGASKTNNLLFTSPTLEKIWQNGYVTVQECNYKTACYTARYVQKKAGIKPKKRIVLPFDGEVKTKIDERTGIPFNYYSTKYQTKKYDEYGREKEFLIMSKKPAIGLKYWLKNKDSIKKNQGILLKIDDSVKQKPIPRYFKKKWQNEDILDEAKGAYEQKKSIEKAVVDNLKKIHDPNPQKKYLEYIKESLLNKTKLLHREEI